MPSGPVIPIGERILEMPAECQTFATPSRASTDLPDTADNPRPISRPATAQGLVFDDHGRE